MKTGSMRSSPTQFARSRYGREARGLPKEPPTSGQVLCVWFTVMIMLVMMKSEFSSCGDERTLLSAPSEATGARLESPMGLERWPSS